ncbi:MAG: bi-domain-containing oxidoreductase [Janthinobacterium lividum]
MKQVLIKSGMIEVANVAAPTSGNKNILVQVLYSCISVGTEIASVKMSSLPLYKRALQQPQNVAKVWNLIKEQGIEKTLKRVRGQLNAGSATGYSAAGVVVEVGKDVHYFSKGDLVACAGAGIANHAEIIDVPVNLAVKIPQALDIMSASTVTLGAIAMQGVRRLSPVLGEAIIVVGLGILGQITAQILKANGCFVIGIDINQERIEHALNKGMDIGINPQEEDYVKRILQYTDGFGADGVLITAASKNNDIIHQAMNACRKKGRVVLVGDVGLDLKREDFYKKELDFFISCSYGPGRYDSVYEEEGIDYPLPYVRWTENRNMQAYLKLLEDKRVSLDGFYGDPFSIDDANAAYNSLKDASTAPLAVFLKYSEQLYSFDKDKIQNLSVQKIDKGILGIGFAGVGGFAQGVHLPNVSKMRDIFQICSIMSRTGSNARAVAMQYEALSSSTNYQDLLNDSDINLIIISTRHDLHASMALQALKAGKNVLLEKPLALNEQELSQFDDFFEKTKNPPVLMVGFNRRFSPSLQLLKKHLSQSTTPLMINYQMNAGYIPADHWVHGAEGGGRNIGEACHIYDLFNFLTGSRPLFIHAAAISPKSKHYFKNDNFIATIKYENGSVCSLTYTALGNQEHPKERMQVFADNVIYEMDDYKSLKVTGSKKEGWSSSSTQKGHKEEILALAQCLKENAEWPISWIEQRDATHISFDVEQQLFQN